MATRTDNRPADVLVRDAKETVTPVAGPYGHPFHPIFVTIPIGSWVCALIFDIASRVNAHGLGSLVDAATGSSASAFSARSLPRSSDSWIY